MSTVLFFVATVGVVRLLLPRLVYGQGSIRVNQLNPHYRVVGGILIEWLVQCNSYNSTKPSLCSSVKCGTRPGWPYITKKMKSP